MSWIAVADIAVGLSLLVGALFTFVGSYGLLKLDEPAKRLHAPTKAGTLGVGALLLASMIHAFAHGEGSLHEALIMAFLFVTAPVSAMFIAKVHLHQRRCMTPPVPMGDRTWATLDTETDPASEASPKTP